MDVTEKAPQHVQSLAAAIAVQAVHFEGKLDICKITVRHGVCSQAGGKHIPCTLPPPIGNWFFAV